jgi:uncharacterized membrane protein YccC
MRKKTDPHGMECAVALVFGVAFIGGGIALAAPSVVIVGLTLTVVFGAGLLCCILGI